MIYKFRIILDAQEDIFRDIEIEGSDSLEDLHNAIAQSFGFDGTEMASFYMSDSEWSQGEEIPLFDMTEGDEPIKLMGEVFIDELLDEENKHLIYVYDFFNMWTFYVELADIGNRQEGISYPNLLFAHGQLPDSPPDKQFEAEGLPELDDDDNGGDFDIDDYDDFGFDENWN